MSKTNYDTLQFMVYNRQIATTERMIYRLGFFFFFFEQVIQRLVINHDRHLRESWQVFLCGFSLYCEEEEFSLGVQTHKTGGQSGQQHGAEPQKGFRFPLPTLHFLVTYERASLPLLWPGFYKDQKGVGRSRIIDSLQPPNGPFKCMAPKHDTWARSKALIRWGPQCT